MKQIFLLLTVFSLVACSPVSHESEHQEVYKELLDKVFFENDHVILLIKRAVEEKGSRPADLAVLKKAERMQALRNDAVNRLYFGNFSDTAAVATIAYADSLVRELPMWPGAAAAHDTITHSNYNYAHKLLSSANSADKMAGLAALSLLEGEVLDSYGRMSFGITCGVGFDTYVHQESTLRQRNEPVRFAVVPKIADQLNLKVKLDTVLLLYGGMNSTHYVKADYKIQSVGNVQLLDIILPDTGDYMLTGALSAIDTMELYSMRSSFYMMPKRAR